MSLQRDDRLPGHPGSWLPWGAVALVVVWALWWMLPHSTVEPASMEAQLVLPLTLHATAAVGLGWSLWRGRVPATSGQLALLVLGAAITMESVALLLLLAPRLV